MAQDTTGKLGSIKAELRAATQEAQKLGMELARMKESTDNIDPNQIKALENQMSAAVEKTAMLKDQINDTNEQIKVMTAGSPFEKMSNGLSDVGSKIMSLDFEGARESAGRLAEMGKTINFKTAISSVKDLGSTFLTLGKSLLANPLFLLAAVIVLIVVAVVKLLDKIGVLKVIMNALGKVFEWIMIPINAIIEGLKMFTDWLGITNNAAEDAAQKQADSAKKIADAYEEKSKGIIQGYDNEIRMLELNGESTRQVELKKAYIILNTAKARAKEAIAAYNAAKLKGELDEKELSDLRKKADEMYRSANQAASDISYLQNKYRKEDADARDKKLKEDQEKQDDADKKAADAAKKANEDAKKRKQERDAARLAADKLIIDLTLANMEDGVEKELAITKEKFKRLQAENAANLLITDKQRKAIADQLATQEIIENTKIKEADNKRKLDLETTFQADLKAIRTDMNATEKELLAIQYEDDVAALNKKLKDEQYTLEQYNAYKEQLDLNYRNKKEAIDAEYAARELSAKLELEATNYEGKLAQLENNRLIELANTELTESERLLIEKKYSDAKLKLIEDEKKARQAEIKSGLDGAAQGLTAIQGLSDAIFANRLSKLEKGSVEEEKAARKQFEINKKLQIAQAIVQGTQATLAAYSSGSAIPVVGAVTGPAFAALAAVTSLANINKIKNSTFQGGTSPTPPGTPDVSAITSAAATPAFNLFGGANQGNNASATKSAESNNQNVNVVATVSVEEITSTQNKVAKVSESASL